LIAGLKVRNVPAWSESSRAADSQLAVITAGQATLIPASGALTLLVVDH